MTPPRATHLDARAIFCVVGLCALWGVQQVMVKLAVADGMAPVMQAALRSVLAGICVAGWIAFKSGQGRLRPLLSPAAVWPGLLIAAMFGLEFLLLYPGVHLTTASRAVVFLYCAPFFTTLGAHLLLKGERLGVVQASGLAVAFVGVVVVFSGGLAGGGAYLLGDLLCLAAGAVWGLTTVAVKVFPALATTSPARLLLVQLLGSAPVLLAGSVLLGEWHGPLPGVLALVALLYQSVVVAFASYLLWFWLIVTYPVPRLAAFTFLAPVFGVLAGVLLMGDPAPWTLAAGLLAVIAGLFLVNRRPAR